MSRTANTWYARVCSGTGNVPECPKMDAYTRAPVLGGMASGSQFVETTLYLHVASGSGLRQLHGRLRHVNHTNLGHISGSSPELLLPSFRECIEMWD